MILISCFQILPGEIQFYQLPALGSYIQSGNGITLYRIPFSNNVQHKVIPFVSTK